jgi:tRNA dimethylallyltransferase
MKKIYVIAGSTASGKSNLAIKLAKSINGEIVNADSIQVYKDIPILTARPSTDEEQGIPHHLYGYLDEHATYSVTKWLEQAITKLNQIDAPIVVGGTGLYIKALTEGLNNIPDVDLSVREYVRSMPIEEVKAKVLECNATDPQRLRRALEVQLTTGKSLKYFQTQPPVRKIDAEFEIIWINRPREEIRSRCKERFLQMLKMGAIQQVKELNSLSPTGGVTKAIGFKEITSYLKQEISYEKMIDLAVIATCQYAKRQQTWFKHQLKYPKIIHNILDFNI